MPSHGDEARELLGSGDRGLHKALYADDRDNRKCSANDSQVAFFKQFCEAPTMAFHRAKGLLVPGYEDWTRQQFPQRWEDAFDFVGMTVPLDGNERNPWDLSFECLRDRGRHHFCCTFEQGNPKSLQIDG